MDKTPSTGTFDRIQVWTENIILTRLVPKDNPGPVFRYIFRIPILLYRLGLGRFVGPHFLLLTTTGRKSGKIHRTPLEFTAEEKTGSYIVSAGWGGKTDWYKNALAEPNVQVQIGAKKFAVEAIPIPHCEVAEQMMEISRRAPAMISVWQRWCDKPIDGTLTSYIYAAQFFPSLRLTLTKQDLLPALSIERTNHEPT
jgi:deazaflavin-dependent oxidoreductase (nitroreductase family)